jgi:hypothetical protein
MPPARTALPLLLAFALALSSCGPPSPSPERDAGRTPTELREQARATSPSKLRSATAAYAARIAMHELRLEELRAALHKLTPGEILTSPGDSIQQEIDALNRELPSLRRNLALYAEELGSRR